MLNVCGKTQSLCILACECSLKLEFLMFFNPVQVSTYQTACTLSCVQKTSAKRHCSIQCQAYSGSWDRQPAASQSKRPILFIESFNGLNHPAESHSHQGPLWYRNKLNKHSTPLSSQKPLSRSPCKNQAHSEGGATG